MIRLRITLVIIAVVMLITNSVVSCSPGGQKETSSEGSVSGDGGWIVLFDGSSTDGWRPFNATGFPGSWAVEEGALKCLGNVEGSVDLVYDRKFGNFELKFEWKISEKGNSGVMYHVQEGDDLSVTYQTGPEYQVLDNDGYAETIGAKNVAGADYDMYAPDSSVYVAKPAGEWNTSRIVYNRGNVEHWLNNQKVVSYTRYSDEWQQRVDNSKWANFPIYAKKETGLIALQNHGNVAWYRNIIVKEL